MIHLFLACTPEPKIRLGHCGFRACAGGAPSAAGEGKSGEPAVAGRRNSLTWVAVKELKLSYYIGETLLFTIYIYPLW